MDTIAKNNCEYNFQKKVLTNCLPLQKYSIYFTSTRILSSKHSFEESLNLIKIFHLIKETKYYKRIPNVYTEQGKNGYELEKQNQDE